MTQQKKPTAQVIVARLAASFCCGASRLALLRKCEADAHCPISRPAGYYDELGEEVPLSAIEDWQEVTL